MIQSMYTAAMGLNSQQKRLDVIGNNMANVSTAGFKSTRVDFKDALYDKMNVAVDGGNNLQNGHGTLINATVRDFRQGVSQNTGNKLDVVIDGAGYFAMRDASGMTYYSRNGNFNVSVEGNGNYLVDANGNYVLNTQNQRISIPGNSTDLIIEPDGTLKMNDGTNIGAMQLVHFTNQDGLEAIGNGGYRPTASSGTPIAGANAQLKQGFLEASNVDTAQEMTLLIRTQRAFSFSSRALRQSDDMEGLVVNMRG